MSAGTLDRTSPRETSHAFGLLARIAVIVFVVEAVIMAMLARWTLSEAVVLEGLLDATLLTLFASPLIYLWAVKRYAVAALVAHRALTRELATGRERSDLLEVALANSQSLLEQNEKLRQRLEQSRAEFAEINERHLQRLGADLHDGPAQLMSFALMRLHTISTPQAATSNCATNTVHELERIRSAMAETLTEIRNMSNGLILPELEPLSIVEVIALAITSFEDRVDGTVAFDLEELSFYSPHALKVCAYRFVQEGLTNAQKHAGGVGLRVTAAMADAHLELKVSDLGPGLPSFKAGTGLGLRGLKVRVEAIGGRFSVQSVPGRGTDLVARFDLDHLPEAADTHG